MIPSVLLNKINNQIFPIDKVTNDLMEYIKIDHESSYIHPDGYNVYMTENQLGNGKKLLFVKHYISDFIRALRASGGILLDVTTLKSLDEDYIQAIIALPKNLSSYKIFNNTSFVDLIPLLN